MCRYTKLAKPRAVSMMRATMFTGCYTAIVTPFTKTGAVDEARLKELVEAQIRGGVDGLVPCGTTGESPTLSHDEKLALFRTVKEAVGASAKVIAGTGNYNTRESIEFTHEVEAARVADGVLLVVPYYNNPPQEGLYRHFRAIAESTSLPAMVYNVPSRTVRNMDAGTTIRLANDVPNIIGVKEATDNLDQVAEIISGVPSDFRLWSGNDGDIYTKKIGRAHV